MNHGKTFSFQFWSPLTNSQYCRDPGCASVVSCFILKFYPHVSRFALYFLPLFDFPHFFCIHLCLVCNQPCVCMQSACLCQRAPPFFFWHQHFWGIFFFFAYCYFLLFWAYNSKLVFVCSWPQELIDNAVCRKINTSLSLWCEVREVHKFHSHTFYLNCFLFE